MIANFVNDIDFAAHFIFFIRQQETDWLSLLKLSQFTLSKKAFCWEINGTELVVTLLVDYISVIAEKKPFKLNDVLLCTLSFRDKQSLGLFYRTVKLVQGRKRVR